MTAKAQHDSNTTTISNVVKLQDLVQKLSEDKTNELQSKAKETFQNLTYMIWITFSLGLVLIAASLLLFVFKGQTLNILGLGGLGVADFVALFFYKPMDRLQEADKDFVEQLIVLKSWALSVNLELLAMNVNDRDTVLTASKNIRTAASWSAHTLQDFLLSTQTGTTQTSTTQTGTTQGTQPKPGPTGTTTTPAPAQGTPKPAPVPAPAKATDAAPDSN